MNNTKPSIVFFGSGPVATRSLELLAKHCEIDAVITKPSTAKEIMAADIPKDTCVYTINTRAELDQLIEADLFENQLGVLIDFGIIVSKKVIDYFEYGIINSHFSLLPDLRGADPITFAILSGQKKTGVSLMLLVEAMDEGPLLGCGVQALKGSETAPELTEKLILLSDALLKKELPRYLSGESRGVDQSKMANLVPDYPSKPTYSRKLTKQDGILDFNKSAEHLEREIRAFIGWPKSRTSIAGKDVVVLKASVKKRPGDAEIGEAYKTDDKKIGIHCKKNDLIIEELKPAGKKAMFTQAFLAGYGSRI